MPLLAALVVFLAVALAACGGSTGSGTTANGSAPAPGKSLSIAEALASTAEGPLLVEGFLVAPGGGEVRLCSALAESYPPQCGGPSLVVVGLDLSTIEGLVSTSQPDLAQVSWTETAIVILGELEDGVLTVSATST